MFNGVRFQYSQELSELLLLLLLLELAIQYFSIEPYFISCCCLIFKKML